MNYQQRRRRQRGEGDTASLADLSFNELRQAAKAAGVSAGGSKAAILARLT